jgi:hypothetical protein
MAQSDNVYYKNGGDGISSFAGFGLKTDKCDLYSQVVKYRYVKPTNDKIVSYIVIPGRPTCSEEMFNGSVRWVYALDSDGGYWYGVLARGDVVDYAKLKLAQLNIIELMSVKFGVGYWMFYSNGIEYIAYGTTTEKTNFSDGEQVDYTRKVLQELVNYKVQPSKYNQLNNDQIKSCNLELFKRGPVLGVDAWIYLAKISLRVEFKFAGKDAASVNHDTVECFGYRKYHMHSQPLQVTKVDNMYTYSLALDDDIIGFWFYDSAANKRLDVDITDIKFC